ncbi:MAG: ATP-dependent DNA helicase, partial [Bacteroidia bacterium]|nr:ATP-dependent DNA helicase [Bacteroidia bacterium]
KIRLKKPAQRKKQKSEPFKLSAPKNLKPVKKSAGKTNLFDSKLTVGNHVNHQRFGKGEVIKIEGRGADLKAEIKFENGGLKKLLLRFAKLEILR